MTITKRDEAARQKLRRHMEASGLKAPDIAALTLHKPQTVRAWMCGMKRVPPRALRILKLED